MQIPAFLPTTLETATVRVRTTLAALLDAFVQSLEPLAARFAQRTRYVAVVESDGIALHAVRDGVAAAPTRLGDGAQRPDIARGDALELRLPADRFLQRTLRLPDAGRDYLQPIIEHRLERLTPWRSDEVLYGFHVTDAAGEDGTIAVELLATSADLVAPHLARLEAEGLSPTALGSAAEPLDAPLRFDLYRGRPAGSNRHLRQRVARAAAIVFAVLVPACLGSLWLAGSAEADLQDSEARLVKLRTQLDAKGGPKTPRDRALLDAKRPETATITLVDRLSRAIPDNTVLRELDVGPDKVRLVGRSGDAPALIPILEADTSLKNPRFAAPVIRDAERRDTFDIVVARAVPQEVVR